MLFLHKGLKNVFESIRKHAQIIGNEMIGVEMYEEKKGILPKTGLEMIM